MTRWCSGLCLIVALLLASALSAARAADSVDDSGAAESLRMAGERIYREGILPSGAALEALAPAGVIRRGADAACIACHRRSGFGTAEGAFVVRPIAGADLYQTRPAVAASPRVAHQLGKPQRPAYDDVSMARVIATGIDVTGTRLREVMPRYQLDDGDMKALIAYLKTIYVSQAPGVTNDVIHLATVIQPGVSAAKRRAMLDVLQAYIHDKNAGVRMEESRRTAGTMRMYRAYRKWVLHVWELEGGEESWPAQLEARYREQPVFALVSGIGNQSWEPIHEFSERFQVPCILPLTNLPALPGKENFYTIYYSRGLALEADALAKYLADRKEARRIVQVYRRDSVGAVAAARFRTAVSDSVRLADMALEQAPSEADRRALSNLQDAVVVLWLEPQDMAAVLPFRKGGNAASSQVYLSASLLDGATVPSEPGILMTYPWEAPSQREPRVRRSLNWLLSKGMALSEKEVQVNAHFAMLMAGEALAHLMDSFSREYFVERVEHNVTTTLLPSYFPRLSLGPDQRYASKGVYVARPEGAGGEPTVVSELIVP